jgi:hypothetical protein
MTYTVGGKQVTMTPEQWSLYQETGLLPEVVVSGNPSGTSPFPKWAIWALVAVGAVGLVFIARRSNVQ